MLFIFQTCKYHNNVCSVVCTVPRPAQVYFNHFFTEAHHRDHYHSSGRRIRWFDGQYTYKIPLLKKKNDWIFSCNRLVCETVTFEQRNITAVSNTVISNGKMLHWSKFDYD